MADEEKNLDAKYLEPDVQADVAKGQLATLGHADYKNADVALTAIEGAEGVELTPEAERKLVRKIDLHLMPILCVVYGLNFLDKTSISYASVMGFQESLNLHGDEYSWLGSMFYFGYLAWEYPTNRLLQRLPLGKYSAFNVVMWGATLSCLAACSNFGGAVAVRFFLGVFEAAVTPAFALFTSQWYTQQEQAARTGIWFSFNGFAQIFGGLVAYGISTGVEAHGAAIDGWKIIFLFVGLLTMTIGVIFFFVVPDNQLNARFLSQEEKLMAVQRIRRNQQGVGNKHFKMYQFKETLTDPMTWAFGFYALTADIPNGGLTNFFSLLITSFGYTSQQSLLYGTIQGAMEVISLVVWGLCSQRWGYRIPGSIAWFVASIFGMCLVVGLPESNNTGRLAGYYLTGFASTPFVALLSLISSNVAGYTKKTTTAAIFLICYCVGNIIGPQTFQSKDAPRYLPAEIAILCCWGVCFFDLVFIWWYYQNQNKKKAKLRADPTYQKLEGQEFLDLTDRENPEFVYSL